MGDPGFRMFFYIIKDSYACRLAPRARRRRNGNQWLCWAGHWLPFTNRSIDVGKEISRVSRIEIRSFTCINCTAASDGNETVVTAFAGHFSSSSEACVGWFNRNLRKNIEVDVIC